MKKVLVMMFVVACSLIPSVMADIERVQIECYEAADCAYGYDCNENYMCVPAVEDCFDGIDNDNDGLIDADDTDCQEEELAEVPEFGLIGASIALAGICLLVFTKRN